MGRARRTFLLTVMALCMLPTAAHAAGRTFEGYGEDPLLVTAPAAA